MGDYVFVNKMSADSPALNSSVLVVERVFAGSYRCLWQVPRRGRKAASTGSREM
jgi:hypothetical protein